MVASSAFDEGLSMIRQRACWMPHPGLIQAPLPLHPWLLDRGSLTARIKARCQRFSLSVVREAFARPHLDEKDLLGLPRGHYAWVREVLLWADGMPVVFAHSIVALRDTRGVWHMARAIGSRPLGAALFADPTIARGALECARIEEAHPLARRIAAVLGPAGAPLWARRSRFLRGGRPLVVTEVFLPGVLALS